MLNMHPQSIQVTHLPDRILQIGLGFMSSKTVLSAIELGLFTVLSHGSLGCTALTARLSLHPRAARDFFDALVSLGMLERRDGQYSNTPEGNLFLDRNKPGYVGGLLEMANSRLYPFWGSLTEGLRTGTAQNEARQGGNPFRCDLQRPGPSAAVPYRDDRHQSRNSAGDRN
jgi:predicted transcriptional regulator